MISIGLTGFTDHPELLTDGGGLTEYAQNFPVVEIDTTAYGIRKQAVVANWQAHRPGHSPQTMRILLTCGVCR